MDNNEYRALKAVYDAYAADCEMGLDALKTRITNMRTYWRKNGQEDMFYNVKGRLKSFDSALEKCDRKKYETSSEGFRKLRDIAGIRITVLSEGDAYKTLDILRGQIDISVEGEIDDYIANPKENGYRSIHLVILINVPLPGGKVLKTPVEVQIRTISMDMHAEPEHAMNYKSNYPDEVKQAICEKFRRIGEMSKEIDDILNEIEKIASPYRGTIPQ